MRVPVCFVSCRKQRKERRYFYTQAMHVYVTGLNWCFTDIPSMQCCAAVQATYRKRQTPRLWVEGRGGGGFFCFLKSSYLSTTHNFVKDCGLKNFNHNLILTCNIYIFIHLIKHKETPGCPSPAPSFMIAFCILDKYLWASHMLLPLGLKEREMTATKATLILDTVSLDRWRTKLGNHRLRKHAIL